MQCMAHDTGECATAAAAAKAGALMALSSLSTTPLEDVAKAGGPGCVRWFQLYVYKVGGRQSAYHTLASFLVVRCLGKGETPLASGWYASHLESVLCYRGCVEEWPLMGGGEDQGLYADRNSHTHTHASLRSPPPYTTCSARVFEYIR